MKQYLLLIQGNELTATTAEEWERFFVAAKASGMFQGGSEVGQREVVGDTSSALSSAHIKGYMRFDSADKPKLLELLQKHPVVLHGGSVELCELPKS
jgi:hypothetical protein